MNTEEQDADPESNDRLIRYLLLRLAEDLHGLADQARLLTAARRAPGARFFRVRRRFNGGLLDIRYALERHAAATPDRSRTASEGATEGRGVPDTGRRRSIRPDERVRAHGALPTLRRR